MRNRRAQPRLPTTLRIVPRDGSAPLIVQDISVGGMFVTSSVPRWPGTLIPMRFMLHGQPRAICATCRVVSLVEVPRGVGLSLMFVRLSDEARSAIASFIDAHADQRLTFVARVQNWIAELVGNDARAA